MTLSACTGNLNMNSIIVVAVYSWIASALWSSTYVVEMTKGVPFKSTLTFASNSVYPKVF